MKIGIFGCGYSGRAIGTRLVQSGATVWGTTRDAKNNAALEVLGIKAVPFDGETPNAALLEALADVTHLIISIAPARVENVEQPDAPVDPVLTALEDVKQSEASPHLRWVGYLSTVGVYGNYDGTWVDEAAPLKPTSARSRQRVRAEAEWLAMGEATGLPVGVFRLSGIYGPGRNALISASEGKSRRLVKTDQVFNRIHVGDIALALGLAARQTASGLFNITDDDPSPPQDVVSFAHALAGTQPPPLQDFETAELTSMARSFYGDNKRVSNSKSKRVLGMDYQWPDYRTALKRMWDEESWKGTT